ncbi:MAG: cupredoxin domain-containing protein [Deltaproteobacteria bacterium]|nr:cupredoxin domain-containing protein [Deltaproteobacteria bacterium]
MKSLRSIIVALALASATLPAAGCSKDSAAPVAAAQGSVNMIVDETGFVPATIKAKVGEPLTLNITRKTDKTCATEIVIKSAGINQPLPMNQPVKVTVTPKDRGEMRFACAMDMIAGKIVVE